MKKSLIEYFRDNKEVNKARKSLSIGTDIMKELMTEMAVTQELPDKEYLRQLLVFFGVKVIPTMGKSAIRDPRVGSLFGLAAEVLKEIFIDQYKCGMMSGQALMYLFGIYRSADELVKKGIIEESYWLENLERILRAVEDMADAPEYKDLTMVELQTAMAEELITVWEV